MTDDDAILKALGARARERQREEEASAEGVPPFDAAAEDRLAAHLLSKIDAKTKAKTEPNVVRPMRWLYAAMPLAAAAAVLVFFATRGTSTTALPAYDVSVVSANEMRAPVTVKTSDAEVTVDPEGELELVARPAVPLKHASARAFLTRGGETTPWPVPIDVSDEGAVKISGPTRVLFPATTGTYAIALIIGAGDTMPSDTDARFLASAPATNEEAANYCMVRARVRFAEKN